MEPNSKPFSRYDSGAEFWRDNVLSYGIDEAVVICGNYLNMNLKCEHSDDERQFCREIFAAMYEATAVKAEPNRRVYPYDFETANERMETSCFYESRITNQECARAIDEEISASHYKTNHYNLELAAISVIGKFGFERVSTVLAHQIQKHESDGRYSGANKKWARSFVITDKAYTFLNSHACLVDSFADYVRNLYTELEL